MDITRLVNDQPPEDSHEKSPEMQIGSQRLPSIPLPSPENGPHSLAQTPRYAPSSNGLPRQASYQSLAPLHTPSQSVVASGQYPFPAQSPAYKTTPGSRPVSYGHLAPSPPQYPGSTHSPTPLSHHSQTPHSTRQSPISMMSHPPIDQYQYQHKHQRSQAETPLGPPPFHPQQSSSLFDMHGPVEQRTYSSASNGISVGSPAMHHHGNPCSTESPTAYPRQSPHLRRTSDYLTHVDCERSVSVSPKTKVAPRPTLKRAAESTLEEPPAKQRKMLRRCGRPTWAVLSKHNPKYTAPNGVQNGVTAPIPRRSAPPTQLPNGDPNTPPLDNDLIHARRMLGNWEKTFKMNTPQPYLLQRVQDWLFVELKNLEDVGTDPKVGIVEIEAKVGTLMKDGERCNLPVATATVIAPAANRNYQFESQMTKDQHQSMNEYLNTAVRDSYKHGRVTMGHEHLYQIDKFYALSKLGQQSLPQSLQRHQTQRSPRLRVTHQSTKNGGEGPVIARIVKLPISHLHIFNPMSNYDCRISINLEVNLDRPDIDPSALIADDQQIREVDRKKDRLSYKHLAYSIDLTKVDREGLGSSFELELEMDSNVVREQRKWMEDGQDNAYTDVVASFLDNATLLMRQHPVQR